MDALPTDDLLGPLMDDLRACLCAQLGDSVPCACTLVPGSIAVADWCSCKGGQGCGQAWVRLDRMYASSRFPSQDSTSTPCGSTMLAAVLEVGVYRCRPITAPGSSSQPPTALQQTEAALLQAADALAMARAITCCDSIQKRPHVLGLYLPKDGGDCSGGAWQVTVKLVPR